MLTVIGRDEIIPLCDHDEVNTAALRRLLFHFIKRNKFHWIAFYNSSSDSFRTAIPDIWIELLELAGLFNLIEEDVLTWWKEVIDAKIHFDQNTNNKIGDTGEYLTCKHEVDRLTADGIERVDKRVIWLAQISDEYHYDISSLRGVLLRGEHGKEDQVSIEVKSSQITSDEVFSFYLTRPEWDTALEDLDRYYFYCWVGVKLDGTFVKGPFIINASKLKDEVPDDSDIAKWEKCYFTLNLNNYCLN